jgi:bis(5'-nucleosyl)-tetraphosphatase (symmetrical)
MAHFAVGDIQGCYDALRQLLDKVNFDPARDTLWAVGDLINRGPQSLETLRFLKSLGDSFLSVLGNHDLHFMALATGAVTKGNKKTLQALLDAPDCDELCQWLRHFPLLHQEALACENGEENFVMIHAGLAVGWSIEQAQSYARELEATLQNDQYLTFLTEMYGNQPDLWHPDLQGMDRLRVMVNIFTRMRFCDSQGRLNLKIKTNIESAPEGYKPWFEYFKTDTKTNILFGHWAALDGITNIKHMHALDTGCVWGRSMTALRLQDKKLFCINCE